MGYTVIADFRGGVDRRRPVYALPPGTLWDGINCHITRGGDVEKRKAFVSLGSFSKNTFGLIAKADQLYTFGSEDPSVVTLPSNVAYQRLLHPDGVGMTALIAADLFGGGIYAAAQFLDGAVLHFYNGTIVSDWTDGVVRSTQGSLATVATALAALIDASPTYSASASGNVITVTASSPGTPFTISTQALNGGAADDQTLVGATTVANVVGVAAVASACGFQVTGGDGTGTLTTLKINGIEVLGATITWSTSNSHTASLIATQIQSNAGSTGWSAVANAQTVTITNVATGTANNGFSLVGTWTNTFTINGVGASTSVVIDHTAGGVDAISAVAQVDTLTLGGTFEQGDGFGVKAISGTANQVIEYFGNFAKPLGTATCLRTLWRKVYVGMGPLIQFCKVNTATKWNVDTDPGAGFFNASTHIGGSESANAFAPYQGRGAIFSRRAIQLWTLQDDDTLNALDQVIENTGTRSPRTAIEFGGNDVFYLDDTGVRSLRARDASNNAFLSDVGVAIDRLVQEWMRSGVSESQIAGACAVVEPVDGRFMLAVGTRIYVYSYFFSSKVAAWTWYEPGFTPTWMVRTKTRVYARGDDNVLYLLGGQSGVEYDSCKVTAQLPFFSEGRPGTFKQFTGADIAATGTWSMQWFVDPSVETNGATQGGVGLSGAFVDLGSNTGVTYPGPNWSSPQHATHIAPLLTHEAPGYACLSEVTLYYAGKEES